MGIIVKVMSIFIALSSFGAHAQQEKVVISEKKQGKRLILMAKNNTQDSLNIFLMVTSKGYRRSASKPVLKDIAPGAKIPMITLIELTKQESTYSYELIINDEEKRADLGFEKETIDIRNVLENKLVIFTLGNCEKCTVLAIELNDRRTQFKMFNIQDDAILYKQFMSFINDELTNEVKIRFPVIWNKDHTLFGYDELEAVINQLEN
jgi:hypothetical protein